METIDTAVVGAGVVGLAAALAVARRGRSVCVLEREPRPGMGTSTHNSQVIHAGMYYPAGSLKARHCVDGARLLYEFCAAFGVPHARCGKIDRGARRGRRSPRSKPSRPRARPTAWRGCAWWIARSSAAREPHVHAVAALFSPNTGILERRGAGAGAGAAVRRARRRRCCPDRRSSAPTSRAGAIRLRTPAETIEARSVVNAAGLYADEVRRRSAASAFTIYPCRGEYVELVPAKRRLVNGLVYPLPHAKGHSLGVHLTKTIFGNVTMGPTVRFQDRKDDYEDDRIPVEQLPRARRASCCPS